MNHGDTGKKQLRRRDVVLGMTAAMAAATTATVGSAPAARARGRAQEASWKGPGPVPPATGRLVEIRGREDDLVKPGSILGYVAPAEEQDGGGEGSGRNGGSGGRGEVTR